MVKYNINVSFSSPKLVEWVDPAGDSEAPVAEVNLVKAQGDHGGSAGGVDRGQRQDESCDRGVGGFDRLIHVALGERGGRDTACRLREAVPAPSQTTARAQRPG